MANIPSEIKKRINNYIEQLDNNNIPVNTAFLFGSYAKGTFNKWSDIDIAIVSSLFKGDRFEDKKLIRSITLKAGSDIEAIPFSIADFVESNPFVKEIIKTGIKIK